MSQGNFGRKRALVAHDSKGRGGAWRKRAMAALMRDAGVQPIKKQGRVMAYRKADGNTVCVKIFYADEAQALDAIAQMQCITDLRKKPVRAYACFFCDGWHITSKPLCEEQTK